LGDLASGTEWVQKVFNIRIELDNVTVYCLDVGVQWVQFLSDVENCEASVNMALSDDDFEKSNTWRGIKDSVILPSDHDFDLNLFGEGVHEAVIELGIVLGLRALLINVGGDMILDLLEGKLSIVVDDVH